MTHNSLFRFGVFAAILAGTVIASDAPPSLAATGQWGDFRYELWLDVASTRSEVDWNPDTQDPPLSVRAALAAARVELRKIVGKEAERMSCFEIKLSPRGRHSCYLVTFVTMPTTADYAGTKSFSPTTMPFAVLLDGTVRVPTKSRTSR